MPDNWIICDGLAELNFQCLLDTILDENITGLTLPNASSRVFNRLKG